MLYNSKHGRHLFLSTPAMLPPVHHGHKRLTDPHWTMTGSDVLISTSNKIADVSNRHSSPLLNWPWFGWLRDAWTITFSNVWTSNIWWWSPSCWSYLFLRLKGLVTSFEFIWQNPLCWMMLSSGLWHFDSLIPKLQICHREENPHYIKISCLNLKICIGSLAW